MVDVGEKNKRSRVGRSTTIAGKDQSEGPEPTHANRESIFKIDTEKKFEYEYYMKDIQIISDVSFGQRNYQRNLEPMLDELVKRRSDNNTHKS